MAAGCPGLGARARLTARPWGVRPGFATHWLWGREMWVCGPVTNLTARSLASWLGVLWGRHKGAPGGGDSCLGVGRPGLGAHPHPTARPWGARPGPATHCLWVRRVWAWGPSTNQKARALASWLCALWVRHEGAQGGAPLFWVRGVRGGALALARRPVLGACGRGPLTTGCGCGGCGCGDPSPTPRRALVRACLARCEAGTRTPGGGHLSPGCWASGVGRSSTPDHPSWGQAAVARYPLAVGAGVMGVGTRH